MQIALALLSLTALLSAETPKPACDKKTQGQFWPEQANRDRALMFNLSRRGELEICSVHGRKIKTFQWETVGVHVSQLIQARQETQGTSARVQSAP